MLLTYLTWLIYHMSSHRCVLH